MKSHFCNMIFKLKDKLESSDILKMWFFDKSSEVNENLGVSPSLSVGGRAIRHSLHSAIATLRSNNTYYPLRKGRTIARQKNEQSRDLSKNQKCQTSKLLESLKDNILRIIKTTLFFP